jgi:hypothetical protein
LLDNIKLHSDVISVHLVILLQNQSSQLKLVGRRRLQLSEPLLGPASQIELGNFEKFIRIEVAHLSSHTEPFSPVNDVFVITPLE